MAESRRRRPPPGPPPTEEIGSDGTADLLTKPFTLRGPPWTDPEHHQWDVGLEFSIIGGRPRVVGLSIRSYEEDPDLADAVIPLGRRRKALAVNGTVLRQLPLATLAAERLNAARGLQILIAQGPDRVERAMRDQSEGREPSDPQMREALRSAHALFGGLDLESAIREMRRLVPADRGARRRAGHAARLLGERRAGRPPEHEDDFYEGVAATYREALGSPGPRAAPTQAVASKFGVDHDKAARYVRRARLLGFLPRTSKGQPRA